jgi:hypothetical protein
MNEAEYQEERARKLRAQLAAQETRDALVYKVLPTLERIAESLAGIASTQALKLKLEAARAGTTVAELATYETSAESPLPPGVKPAELFAHTQEELETLDRAHKHAVAHLGAEKAEALGLGLYSWAEEQGLTDSLSSAGAQVDEPTGVINLEAFPEIEQSEVGSPVRG